MPPEYDPDTAACFDGPTACPQHARAAQQNDMKDGGPDFTSWNPLTNWLQQVERLKPEVIGVAETGAAGTR
jgi:hypothetical protein